MRLRSLALTCLLCGCGSSSAAEPVTPLLDAASDAADAWAEAPFEAGHDEASEAEASPEADGPDVVEPPRPLLGIYALSGSDSRWGSYHGKAEIREGPGGTLSVHHVQEYDTAEFEGDRVALAWEGSAEQPASPAGPYSLSVRLAPVGFIKTWKNETREGSDPTPWLFTASFDRTAPDTLQGTFASQQGLSFTESWSWLSGSAPEPLWRNERVLIPTHPPVPDSAKQSLFATYGSYHALPKVAPYAGRPEFKEAMHYAVFDPTDFAYYRENPGSLRVIQKIVDPISLVESRLRNRAYRQTLAEKAAYYETETPLHHLDESGMLFSWNPAAPAGQQKVSSMSSMLWTGVYMASQALRHLDTGTPEALQNMLLGLQGQFLCWDIVGVPGQFARAARVHQPGANDGWVQGQGAYSGFDYLPGGNNDMLQGYYAGFAWSWLVLKDLPGYEPQRAKMVTILKDLVAGHPDAADHESNELKARMLLFWMTKDLQHKLAYEALFQAVKVWLVDQGNGPLWQYGTSDWSGNHLILHGLLVPWLVSHQVGDGHQGEMTKAMRNAMEKMRSTRLGLFQLVTATLSGLSPLPPEVEEALWVLREFPAPKEHHEHDWRLDPQFCMSPFPALPWKADWESTYRFQGIHAWPAFERDHDVFAFRSNPMSFEGAASPLQDFGVDYLFAYWFGRYFKVIQPGM